MIREITRQQIEIKIAQGEKLTLVEAQAGESSYDFWHLPGAVPIPPVQVSRLAREYIPDFGAEIVIYGEDEFSNDGEEVARQLSAMGYTELYLYRAGKRDWFEAGEYGKAMHEPPQPGMRVHFAGESEEKSPTKPQAENDYEKSANAFNLASSAE